MRRRPAYLCGQLLLAGWIAAAGNATYARDPVPAQPNPPASPNCLTPAAGRALGELVAAGGLRPALGSEFTLVRADVGGQQIELEIQDTAQRAYQITLALPGWKEGTPDAEGQHFHFYLPAAPAPPPPPAADALRALARLVDATLPPDGLARCAAKPAPADRGLPPALVEANRMVAGPGPEGRYPRWFALVCAVAELAVILIATAYGLRALPKRNDDR